MLSQDLFVHHVYFWLENPDSVADREALLEGLNKLAKVPTIRSICALPTIYGGASTKFSPAGRTKTPLWKHSIKMS